MKTHILVCLLALSACGGSVDDHHDAEPEEASHTEAATMDHGDDHDAGTGTESDGATDATADVLDASDAADLCCATVDAGAPVACTPTTHWLCFAGLEVQPMPCGPSVPSCVLGNACSTGAGRGTIISCAAPDAGTDTSSQ